MKKLLIFSSGTKDSGGSGFQELVENSVTGILKAEIVGVVSNHENGGVRKRADALGIKFFHSPKPRTAGDYQHLVAETRADFVALSGWLGFVEGLDPSKTINIHPGPLPRFGGNKWHGHFVHEKVAEAIEAGTAKTSAATMHFVTEIYDEGPVIFRYPVLGRRGETAEELGARVNKIEHGWQSFVTNLVVQGLISWDGVRGHPVKFPEWYNLHEERLL